MGMILSFPFDEQPGSLAEADAEGGRKRAGADTALLAAAVKQGVDGDAVANPQCADALGSENPVAGEGDHVEGVERYRDTHEALHGVAAQERRQLGKGSGRERVGESG